MFKFIANLLGTTRGKVPNVPNIVYANVGSDSDEAVCYFGGQPKGIDNEQVLGIPAYWRGVNTISDRIANLPLELWEEDSTGNRTAKTRHTGRCRVVKSFDDWMSASEGIRTITANALRFGNGFGLVHRNADNANIIDKISVIEPHRVAIRRAYFTDGSMIPSYDIESAGVITNYAFYDVIHVRGLSPDGLVGFSLIEKLNTALSLNLNLYRHSEEYFENNATPRTIVTYPLGSKVSEKTLTSAREEWRKTFQGRGKNFGTFFTSEGATVNTLSDSAAESSLLAEKQFSLVDVANIVCCPVSRLNGQQVTSYSSLESDNKLFLEDCLERWLTQWESEMNLKLLTEDQKNSSRFYFEFDRSELDTPDLQTLTTCLDIQAKAGAINRNEMRAGLGYGPVDDGDVYLIASGMVTVDSIINPPEPPPIVHVMPPNQDPNDTATDEQDTTDQPADDQNVRSASVARLMTRLVKSAHKEKNDDWFNGHLSVFRSALPNEEQRIDDFFSELRQELEATSTKDHGTVIEYRTKNNKLEAV